MRKEVEVKARVADGAALIKKIEALGCAFGAPIRQDDVIYVMEDEDLVNFKKKNVPRLRRANGKILLTVKQAQTNELDRMEHEFEVDDFGEAASVLGMLGFHEVVQVHKERRKTKYGEYEICVDNVDGLGSFVEVEKVVDDVDGEKVQDELFGFLVQFGVRKEDRVTRGYDQLIYDARRAQ